MAEKIIMPKQGLQMTEGTINKWMVAEGGTVAEGQPLFEMETDKLTIVIDAAVSGTLLKIVAQPGDVVPITETIAIVGQPGEDISSLLPGAKTAAGAPAVLPDTAAPLSAVQTTAGAAPAEPVSRPDGRVFISPRAKTKAAELGVDYTKVSGSGTDGMVVERDVLAAAQAQPKATPLARKAAEQCGADLAAISGSGPRGKIMRADVMNARPASGERRIIPLSGMRRVIAGRMKQSQNENAQTTHRVSVRMDEAFRMRAALEKTVGFNDIVAYATVRALCDFPAVNAEWTSEGIWQKDFVNLGVAVALEEGLIVPVIKGADRMSLQDLSQASKALAEKARGGGLAPEDYTGGGFTVSNLGMYGLDDFVAIINPPEAGILAVGKIEKIPVAVEDRVEIHPVMRLTLSYDHRVIDGAPAARFLVRIKEYLENPYKLL